MQRSPLTADLRAVSHRMLRLVAVAGMALTVAACSNTPKPDADLSANGAGGAYGAGGRGGPATPGSQKDFSTNVGDLVYFSTDSVDLTPEAQQTLSNQARWLAQYSQYTITLEGHADERGTREYNIGLGQKRAENVRAFLAKNGVPAARVRTTSFGKERPVAVCNDISCWSQNRRVQTVLNNRGVAGGSPPVR